MKQKVSGHKVTAQENCSCSLGENFTVRLCFLFQIRNLEVFLRLFYSPDFRHKQGRKRKQGPSFNEQNYPLKKTQTVLLNSNSVLKPFKYQKLASYLCLNKKKSKTGKMWFKSGTIWLKNKNKRLPFWPGTRCCDTFSLVPLGLNNHFQCQAVGQHGFSISFREASGQTAGGTKAILDPAQCCNFLKYRALAVAIVACDGSELWRL